MGRRNEPALSTTGLLLALPLQLGPDMGTPELLQMGVPSESHQYSPEYAWDLMMCMPWPSQHHAIGLQTDCMVVVPPHVVRLPDSHVYALWP